MPPKTIYIPDDAVPYWDAASDIARRHNRSISSVIVDELKTLVRERQGDTGVPLGVPIPASMKDPVLVEQEQKADTIADIVRDRVLQALRGDPS